VRGIFEHLERGTMQRALRGIVIVVLFVGMYLSIAGFFMSGTLALIGLLLIAGSVLASVKLWGGRDD
jgi:hypothetical protein